MFQRNFTITTFAAKLNQLQIKRSRSIKNIIKGLQNDEILKFKCILKNAKIYFDESYLSKYHLITNIYLNSSMIKKIFFFTEGNGLR